MKSIERFPSTLLSKKPRQLVGSLGHMTIFLWALSIVLLKPANYETFILLGCLIALVIVYPSSIHRLSSPRWFIIFIFLFVINAFFGGSEADLTWGVLSISSEGLLAGVQMTLRALIILLAANGMAASMDISEITSIFERVGLHGLGFSVGVALNLLPSLLQSSAQAWHSLRMRGGLRARWWRGLKLVFLTILTNALRRSEEIVLAAEARAFHPECSKTVPIKVGHLDVYIVVVGLFSVICLILSL